MTNENNLSIDWDSDSTIRAFQIYNYSLPSSKKLKIKYIDQLGEDREIVLIRKFALFDPSETSEMKPNKILSFCSQDEEELELLLLQDYETIWSVYCTHHWVSINRLNRISDSKKNLGKAEYNKPIAYSFPFLDKDKDCEQE